MKIEKDRVVTIDYTLKNAKGEVLDTSEGQEPLMYLQGYQNLIPGLENRLEGLGVGEELTAVVPPEEAYGLRDDSNIQVVKKEMFPPDPPVEVGMSFHVQDQTGNLGLVTVVKIEGEEVTLDNNHPLAGVELHFDVSVKDIREATKEELDHGHVHQPGHHHH